MKRETNTALKGSSIGLIEGNMDKIALRNMGPAAIVRRFTKINDKLESSECLLEESLDKDFYPSSSKMRRTSTIGRKGPNDLGGNT